MKATQELFKKNTFDAGWDITSAEDIIIPARSSKLISTELHVAIDPGYVGLLWSRSGLSVKYSLEVGAGCIDSGYTGEVKVHLYNHSDEDYKVLIGDRIAQLLVLPIWTAGFSIVHSLDETTRGANGFGSSGK